MIKAEGEGADEVLDAAGGDRRDTMNLRGAGVSPGIGTVPRTC